MSKIYFFYLESSFDNGLILPNSSTRKEVLVNGQWEFYTHRNTDRNAYKHISGLEYIGEASKSDVRINGKDQG